MNPSRDWSASIVRPDAIINETSSRVDEDPVVPTPSDATSRYEVSFRIGMMKSTLLKEDAAGAIPLLDLCVNNLSVSVLAEGTWVLTTAQVLQVHMFGSAKHGDTEPYNLLSQRVDDSRSLPSESASPALAPSSECMSCFSMQMTSTAGAATVCKMQMPTAFSMSIDPRTVAGISQLQAQVSDVWRNLRKAPCTPGGATSSSHSIDFATPDTSLPLQTALSSNEKPSLHTQAHTHTHTHTHTKYPGVSAALMVLPGIEKVPSQFLDEKDKRTTRLSIVVEAVGLHVLLIDDCYQELALLKMQTVSLVKTNFANGAAAVTATLGKVEVVDKSTTASLHPKFMTVSEEAGALVQVDVQLYDKTSAGCDAACENLWQIRIFRPRITLLWRFIGEILQYQRLFSSISPHPPVTSPATPDDKKDKESSAPSDTSPPSAPAAEILGSMAYGLASLASIGGPTKRGTLVKINLEHPELILPRSSTCNDAFYADLGRIDVERASRHSSEKWSMSFKETHLDTMHTSLSGEEIKLPCIHDLDGTAQIKFCEAGAETGEPEMCVDVELETLRGSMTDSQYALLMSIVGENFTEKRVEGAGLSSPFKPVKRPFSHLAEDGTLGDKLGELVDLARGLTAHRVPSSAYNVSIRDVELALNGSKSYGKEAELHNDVEDDCQGIYPLLHARAADLRVRYEVFAGDGNQVVGEGLDSSCVAQLGHFELIDTRIGAVRKSEPLFCVRGPCTGKNSSLKEGTVRAGCGDSKTADVDEEGQKVPEDELIIFQFFRLSQGHTDIDAKMRNVDTVFDIGLLVNTIGWLGTSNGPAVNTDGFTYVVTRTGGFRVQTDLPDSSIHLVTAFDRADADGFDMNGSLSVMYASSASEDVLHVKVDDLVLKVREHSEHPGTTNHNMDVVRPCTVIASWQWFRRLDAATAAALKELLEADHKRSPKFFFAASDLRAMVTYEHMMLAMRVYSCLMSTLADSKNSSSSSSTRAPAHNLNKCPDDEGAANRLKIHSADLAPEDSNAESPQQELDLRIQGSGIMVTLIDDFAGRSCLNFLYLQF